MTENIRPQKNDFCTFGSNEDILNSDLAPRRRGWIEVGVTRREEHVRDEELIERAVSVSYDDFVRAHHLMAPREVAEAALREILASLRASPENTMVMGPEFLAVLALFSERGRQMAEAAMPLDELQRLQRRLAKTTPAIARAFPSVLLGDDS
jgi:hypothetical protein